MFRIMHWNFFKSSDNMSGAKRYEEELYKEMYANPEVRVEQIKRRKRNFLLESSRFAKSNNEVVHATFQMLAPLKLTNRPKNFVLTVHDLIPKIYYSKTKKIRNMWPLIEYSIKKANKIITDSEFSKIELIRLLNITPEKIFIVPLGVSENYRQLNKYVCKQKLNLDLDVKHILVVSSNEPWKNMKLVNEIIELSKEHKDNYKFVKVGYGEILDNPNVINLGYIPEEDMPTLYNACDLFLHTSLYEGFGLPVLEAMKCGCPVVSSDACSLPEIVGNAGILVRADREDSKYFFMSIICMLLEKEEFRLDYIKRGLARASEFTWEETARKTLEIYKK